MRYLGNAFLLCVCAVVTARTIWQLPPAWNWDVLGYMGVTLEWELDNPVEVHRETYAAAREELPPAVFRSLANTGGSAVGVRAARYRDPSAFHEHIAFYRARILPTYAAHLLHRAGAPLSSSIWWLALASFAATGVLLFFWLVRWTPMWAAIIGATLFLHAPPLLSSATMATPDSLGTFLLALGAYLLIERRASQSGAAVMTLAILARPDAIILIGVLGVTLLFIERARRDRLGFGFIAGWIAVSTAVYFGANSYGGSYGWWPLFHISFINKEIFPAELATTPDWKVWLGVLRDRAKALPDVGYWGTKRGVTGSSFAFVYAGFVVLALSLWRRAPEPERLARYAGLLLALVVTYIVRWFLFPAVWDRFFALFFVLVPLCLLSMAGVALRSRSDDSDARSQNASNDETASITSP